MKQANEIKSMVVKFEAGFSALDQANDEEKLIQMDAEEADNEEVQQQVLPPDSAKDATSSSTSDESINSTNDEKRKAPNTLAQTSSSQHSKSEAQLLSEGQALADQSSNAQTDEL
jgi:hypothetical protein